MFGTAAELGPTHVEIDDIWLLDDANHAASVDLNAGRLGPVQAWRDDSRDVLNFVAHVLPAVYAGEGRPGWQLAWTAAAPNMPKVVGIGHSFGGNALVQAAAARPDLFEGLFLVDPMVPPHYVPYERWLKERFAVYALSAGAIRRRTHWPSRAEAATAMRAQPFFAAWDKDVFDLYVAHGLVPVDYAKPEGEVTLATPSWSEAAVFTEPEGVAHGWMALPKLECPVGFVMANVPVATYGEERTRDMVWRAPRARNERFPDAGHLVRRSRRAVSPCGRLRELRELTPDHAGEAAQARREHVALLHDNRGRCVGPGGRPREAVAKSNLESIVVGLETSLGAFSRRREQQSMFCRPQRATDNTCPHPCTNPVQLSVHLLCRLPASGAA